MSDVAGLMLNTIQYTYGVMGALESSTTSAMLFVPDGQPAQPSGGLLGRLALQVKRGGMTPPVNSPLVIDMTLGVAISAPEPNSPHPDRGNAVHAAMPAAASRRAARPRASLTPRSYWLAGVYWPSALPEGTVSGQGLAEDQRVHFGRALIGEHGLQVGHVPHDGELIGDAVPAEDRPRGAADLQCLAHVVQLPERDVLGGKGAGVLEPPEVQRHQLPLAQLDRHVGELLLGELEAADRRAELRPGSRVLQRRLIARAGRAERSPQDAVARLVQAGQRAAQPPDLGERRVRGQ